VSPTHFVESEAYKASHPGALERKTEDEDPLVHDFSTATTAYLFLFNDILVVASPVSSSEPNAEPPKRGFLTFFSKNPFAKKKEPKPSEDIKLQCYCAFPINHNLVVDEIQRDPNSVSVEEDADDEDESTRDRSESTPRNFSATSTLKSRSQSRLSQYSVASTDSQEHTFGDALQIISHAGFSTEVVLTVKMPRLSDRGSWLTDLCDTARKCSQDELLRGARKGDTALVSSILRPVKAVLQDYIALSKKAPSVSPTPTSNGTSTPSVSNELSKQLAQVELEVTFFSSLDLNVTDASGWTPLLLAAHHEHLGVLEELCWFQQPWSGKVQIPRTLICDINHLNSRGQTALMLALKANHMQAARRLLLTQSPPPDVLIRDQDHESAMSIMQRVLSEKKDHPQKNSRSPGPESKFPMPSLNEAAGTSTYNPFLNAYAASSQYDEDTISTLRILFALCDTQAVLHNDQAMLQLLAAVRQSLRADGILLELSTDKVPVHRESCFVTFFKERRCA